VSANGKTIEVKMGEPELFFSLIDLL